jgi:hypothetical protein
MRPKQSRRLKGHPPSIHERRWREKLNPGYGDVRPLFMEDMHTIVGWPSTYEVEAKARPEHEAFNTKLRRHTGVTVIG